MPRDRPRRRRAGRCRGPFQNCDPRIENCAKPFGRTIRHRHRGGWQRIDREKARGIPRVVPERLPFLPGRAQIALDPSERRKIAAAQHFGHLDQIRKGGRPGHPRRPARLRIASANRIAAATAA